MIRITSKKDGFRRCGVAHPGKPTEHPDDRFTKKELERLKDEPMLFVEVIKEKKAPPAKSPPEKKAPPAKSPPAKKDGDK